MKGVVVLDTNLMVLLTVGSAARDYIAKHKRLQSYTVDDFDLINILIAQFSDIVLIPHILSEASSIARQISQPALRGVQSAFRRLISGCTEYPVPSVLACERSEFARLGLTDAVILHFCSLQLAGIPPTLLTTDTDLADSAIAQGHSVIDYKREYQAP